MSYKTLILRLTLSLACIVLVLLNSGAFPLVTRPLVLSNWTIIEPSTTGKWNPTNHQSQTDEQKPAKQPSQIGQWKLGLRYNQTRRMKSIFDLLSCNKTVRQLHFVFNTNSLNKDNVLHSLRTKIRGKNITIFGDSLQKHFAVFMAEVLNMNERKPDLHYVYHSRKVKLKSQINLQVKNVWEYGNYLCKGDPNSGRFVMRKKNIVQAFSESDIIVFNLGLHYENCSISTYRAALEEVAGLLKEELTRYPHKQVVFRSTLPQHFYMGKNIGGYFPKFNKHISCYGVNNVQHWTNKYMKEVSKRYGFKYLDSFPIYADRWDLHFPNKTMPDCTHFCFTPETIIPELALLEQLLTF